MGRLIAGGERVQYEPSPGEKCGSCGDEMNAVVPASAPQECVKCQMLRALLPNKTYRKVVEGNPGTNRSNAGASRARRRRNLPRR